MRNNEMPAEAAQGISRVMGRLSCFFGLHAWRYSGMFRVPHRYCVRCRKVRVP